MNGVCLKERHTKRGERGSERGREREREVLIHGAGNEKTLLVNKTENNCTQSD